MIATTDYKWFNGRTMAQATCDSYNALSARIDQREALNIDADALRNARHNLVVSWMNAVTPKWNAVVE